MDGLNSTCLGIFLCPVALVIGAIAVAALSPAFKTLLTRKGEGRYAGLSGILAGALALVVACIVFYLMYAPSFPDYYQPFWRPNESDIVGTWTPATFSLHDMEEAGYPISTHSVEFRENGDFIMTNLPDNTFWKRKGELYSGTGTWRIENYGEWVVLVVLSSQSPPYYADPPLSGPTPCPGKSVPCEGYKFSFGIWERDPPYVLYLDIIGLGELDPDFMLERLGDVHEQP